MHVQVRHGFAGMRAIVDHEPETFGELHFPSEFSRHQKQVAEERLVGGACSSKPSDQLFRNDQEMHRRLRLNIVNDDAMFVFKFNPGWNLAIDDSLENSFRHVGR